jgi:hypothetical protein
MGLHGVLATFSVYSVVRFIKKEKGQGAMNSEQRTIKKVICLLIFLFYLLIFNSLVFGQTAAELERLYESTAVTYGQAAWFVLQAADVPAASPTDAFNHAMENNWLPASAEANSEARLNDAALLVMRAFGLKGGLMYRLLQNPRYAYRELVYREVIQGRTDPELAVSGEMLIYIVNRVIN